MMLLFQISVAPATPYININNVNTSSVKVVVDMSFLPLCLSKMILKISKWLTFQMLPLLSALIGAKKNCLRLNPTESQAKELECCIYHRTFSNWISKYLYYRTSSKWVCVKIYPTRQHAYKQVCESDISIAILKLF